MNKLIASLIALAAVLAAMPAQACPFSSDKTAQSTPVVTSDANGTAPMAPVPPPATTKTGS
jgi:hypothetical protein